MNKKTILLAVAALALVLLAGLFVLARARKTSLAVQTNSGCLQPNEKAMYTILQPGAPATVRVSVMNAASSTVWSRDIQRPDSNVFDPVLPSLCHFYFFEQKNYNYTTQTPGANYLFRISRLSYFSSASSSAVITLSYDSSGSEEAYTHVYDRTYIIDPSEKYLTLVKGDLGDPDYALVFKDIITGQDVYTLSLADILKDHPNAAGSFSTGEWVTHPDGVWMEGDIYDGSRWTAFYYIKRDTWETHIYDTPADYMAGVERAAPPFAPYLAYTNVVVWAGGSAEVADELLDQQISAGMQKSLIFANLATGATTTIVTVPIDKNHSFNPTWLDDSTLQYTMPDGTTRTYTVK